ncbi:MAG: aminoacyl-tRNA hydrolase [Chloroflexi bacterium]|nr:aminoacyl-tRNA hydrolase [Chloroflexota bacterium]
MKLIVGLGNPGKEYALSRHNIGFRCINHFSRKYGIDMSRKKAKATVGNGAVDGQKVLLAKPRTFMNLSGESVVQLLQQNGLESGDLVVVYDDMDLPLGKVRIRPSGGSGGHKGMESIIRLTGTLDFTRIRVGIGRPGGSGQAAGAMDHVLGQFFMDEEKAVDKAIERVCQALRILIVDGLDRAMNEFNKEGPESPNPETSSTSAHGNEVSASPEKRS